MHGSSAINITLIELANGHTHVVVFTDENRDEAMRILAAVCEGGFW